MLGARIPLFNAPMTPQAGGALARAVSDTGAFGMLGFDEDESADAIREQLAILTALPRVRFGIGLVAWVLERRPELLELAIEAKPALISISFGDPAPYAERVHAAGALLGSQVQNRASAQTAIDAGADVIVAQGAEAGGHTGSHVATLPLLQILLEMTEKPVVAAGGIANGRGLAAVLAAGAAGAWVGTPFLFAQEARNSPEARRRLIDAGETDTIYTRVYDRVAGKAWPEQFGGRALRTPFLERWTGHEQELLRDEAALARFDRTEKIYAGQSVGAQHGIRSAADIVRSFAAQAKTCLGRVCDESFSTTREL